MLIASVDLTLLVIAFWMAFSLQNQQLYSISNLSNNSQNFLSLFFITPLIGILIFHSFGLYRDIIRYISLKALWGIVKAVTTYVLFWYFLVLIFDAKSVSTSLFIIHWMTIIILIGSSRMMARCFLGNDHLNNNDKNSLHTPVVIYGAGSAGMQLANALSYSSELKPIAFIDDDKALQNNFSSGLQICSFTKLSNLIENNNIKEVLLALPSTSRTRRNEILALLEPYPVKVKTIPGVAEIAQGKVKVEDIREIEIQDLLGREPVSPVQSLLKLNITDKVVMVTGAGGSIGSELCRQIGHLSPKALILFELNEYALYQIHKELCKYTNIKKTSFKIIPFLGNVTHQLRIEKVCQHFSVQTIFHTAAYKHVPMVELNTIEGVQNNIFGTYRCAQAAMNSKVETFVLISTDKAVRPTNTMGATKRFAELILQSFANHQQTDTKFTMVRFGNVLGSSGSVVPLFREQIKRGGPVTVTHPKIIRYFMTIPEAAQLVIQAGAMGKGGDVFVLDMDEPVKILDLARRMIRLSGFEVKDQNNPDGDVEIAFSGLRDGEKLYEELLIGDNVSSTNHPKIMRAEEDILSDSEIKLFLE
ncbi:MAG: polysaccharide biosynthesis protein, partial [Methylococcales bacterium]|nr:polysaccharide biosynthesis protein [Methylococcales bacterium]